jgi:hypothetical protein
MTDAMWIADLQACSVIKASLVPTEEMQKRRSLTPQPQATHARADEACAA